MLYLAVALPLSIGYALVTVMFDVPDEPAHLFRAVQVGEGGFIAARLGDGGAGGWLPAGAIAATGLCGRFRRDPSMRIDAASLAPYRTIGWQGASREESFVNTATYPPVFYVADAAAIDAGRILGLRVIATFRAARIADAAASTVVSSLAILAAGTGTPMLVAVLALPMTLSSFGSASQDALLIASAALAAALLSGHRPEGQPEGGRAAAERTGGWRLAAAGLLIGMLGAARPPYALLASLPAIAAWRTPDRWRGVKASALALAVAALWIRIGLVPFVAPTRAGGGLLDGAQMHWIVHHPRSAVLVGWHSLGDAGDLLSGFIGVLGWLSIRLPTADYRACRIVLLVAAVASLAGRGPPSVPRLVVAAVLAATAAAIELALYLSWSRLGATHVVGVQGRYFLPIALFASLLGRRSTSRSSLAVAGASVLVLGAVSALGALPAVAGHFRR